MEQREMPIFVMTEVEPEVGVIGNQYWVERRRAEAEKEKENA